MSLNFFYNNFVFETFINIWSQRTSENQLNISGIIQFKMSIDAELCNIKLHIVHFIFMLYVIFKDIWKALQVRNKLHLKCNGINCIYFSLVLKILVYVFVRSYVTKMYLHTDSMIAVMWRDIHLTLQKPGNSNVSTFSLLFSNLLVNCYCIREIKHFRKHCCRKIIKSGYDITPTLPLTIST